MTPVWLQVQATFKATAEQALIQIQDINLQESGNDWAIDDITVIPAAGGAAIFKEDFEKPGEFQSDYHFITP